ncbi:MAG: hypothetical protein BroJett011_62800 [Chloroflexota bacterium]|nr:MAG: hypothetical protein BroJett011_62800 [Chloroflexota bacterium]
MLKYIGQGAFLPGVPARDLSAEEAKEYGEARLLKSGLYKKVGDRPAGESLPKPRKE